MKRWAIRVPIFEQEIIVIQSEDLSVIEQYLHLTYDFPLDTGTPVNFMDGAVFTLNNGAIVIGLSNNDLSTILHECCHAVFRLQEIIGSNDEEQHCYLVEWLYKQVCKAVNV